MIVSEIVTAGKTLLIQMEQNIADFIETGILIVTQDNYEILYGNNCFKNWFPDNQIRSSINSLFPEFKKDLATKRINKNGYYDWESPSFQIKNETIRLLFSFKPYKYNDQDTYFVEVKNDTRSLEKESRSTSVKYSSRKSSL